MNRQTSVEATSSNPPPSGPRRKSLDDAPTAVKFKASSFGQMLDAVKAEAQIYHLWNEEMHRDLPKKWEKHGDLVILPHTCFLHPNWRMLGRRLWQIVAEALQTPRLGRKRRIADDEFHTPHIDLLYGAHGWVEHLDNGVRYLYDVTKCMFSIQNASEKARIAQFDCHQETVVDLFAGIGYYTLPFLVHASAKHVYAIDWNADAIEALNRNLEANNMTSRCTVIEGDCRKVCPSGVADRVNMGLLPTSKQYWLTGCRALKSTGGILHAHDTVPNAQAQAKKPKTEPERVKRRERLVQLQNGSSSLGSVSEESEIADLPGQSPNAKSIPKTNGKSDVHSVEGVVNGDVKANGEHKKTDGAAAKTAPNKANANGTSKNSKTAKRVNGEGLHTDITVIKELLAKITDEVSLESLVSIKKPEREQQTVNSQESSVNPSTAAKPANGSLKSKNLPNGPLNPESKQKLKQKSKQSNEAAAPLPSDTSSTIDNAQAGSTAASNGEINEVTEELNKNGEKKRKFSRSASIVEQIESLLIPNPKIEKTFRKEKWNSLEQSWRDFSIECATACCKYLNNMHFEQGKMWTCTVLRVGKVKPYSVDIDHIVVDIDCRPVSDTLAFSDQDTE